MGKLIDGDKLISTLVWGHYGLCKELQTVQQAINDMRGEDAVPVIRCKDCEFYNPEKMCVAFSWIRGSKIKIRKDEEDFCSWAMKKKK